MLKKYTEYPGILYAQAAAIAFTICNVFVFVLILILLFVIVFVTLTILHTKQNEAIRVGSSASPGALEEGAELWLHYNYSLITHS